MPAPITQPSPAKATSSRLPLPRRRRGRRAGRGDGERGIRHLEPIPWASGKAWALHRGACLPAIKGNSKDTKRLRSWDERGKRMECSGSRWQGERSGLPGASSWAGEEAGCHGREWGQGWRGGAAAQGRPPGEARSGARGSRCRAERLRGAGWGAAGGGPPSQPLPPFFVSLADGVPPSPDPDSVLELGSRPPSTKEALPVQAESALTPASSAWRVLPP